ncbi:MAG: hypothetical protein CVV41_06565 [Candidatus Riflebacteria bacterium HGW-Riflebacteria-1]|jgi:class 3 adenylate cyclase|nr:MAG: hypothetical protein CVV41_06565 [Candidatus Riflebacteria bacterium HGW-Riflebacteria-1]
MATDKGSNQQFSKLTPTAPATGDLLLFWLLTLALPLLAIFILVRHSENNRAEQLKTELSGRMLDSMNRLQQACNAETYFKNSVLSAEMAAGLPPRHANLVSSDALPAAITQSLKQRLSEIKGFKLVMLITGRNDFSDLQIIHGSSEFSDYPKPGQWAARTLLKAVAARIRGQSTDQGLSAAEQRMLRNFNDSIFGTYFSPIDKDEDFVCGFNVRNGGTNLHTARRLVQTANKAAEFTYLAIFAETPLAFQEAFTAARNMAGEFDTNLVLRQTSLHQFIIEKPDTSLHLYSPISYVSLNTAPHSGKNIINRLLRLNAARQKPFLYPHLQISSQPVTRLISHNYFYAKFAIFLLLCLSLLAIKHFQQHGAFQIRIRSRLFIAVFMATLLPASVFLFMAYRHNRQQEQIRQNNLVKDLKTRLKMFELNLRSQDEKLGVQASDLASELRKNMAATDNEISNILNRHTKGNFDGAMLIRSNGLSLEIIDPESAVMRNNPEKLSFSRDIFFAAIINFFNYLGLTHEQFDARLTATPQGKKLKALATIFTREDVENFCNYEGTALTSKRSAATLRFINFKILPDEHKAGVYASVLLLAQDIRKVVEAILSGPAHDWSFYHQHGKEGTIKTVLLGTYDLEASSLDPESIWPAGSILTDQQRALVDTVLQGKGEASQVTSSDAVPRTVMVARKIGGYPLIALSYCAMQKMKSEHSRTELFLIICLAYLLLILSVLASILDELFAEPIEKLLTAARLTGAGCQVELVSSFDNELSQLTREFNHMSRHIKERERLERFVSSEAVQVITRESRELSDIAARKETRSILFMHIRGFDKLSEQLSPEILIELLNQYFSFSEQRISMNHGQIDKYIGDAIMAVFSENEGTEPSAARACATAAAIVKEVAELNQNLAEKFMPQILVGAGIASGEVISGRIGAQSGRRDYTVIGDRVNLAARLEAMSHFSDQMHILVDQQTMHTAKAQFSFKNHGELPVKGKSALVQIYELL